jgi:hypothetical protein
MVHQKDVTFARIIKKPVRIPVFFEIFLRRVSLLTIYGNGIIFKRSF